MPVFTEQALQSKYQESFMILDVCPYLSVSEVHIIPRSRTEIPKILFFFNWKKISSVPGRLFFSQPLASTWRNFAFFFVISSLWLKKVLLFYVLKCSKIN